MSTSSEAARQRAEQRFQKISERERAAEQSWREQEKLAKATAEKMDRLRALRLARETAQSESGGPSEADRAAADLAAQQRADLLAIGKTPAPPAPKRVRKSRAVVKH